MSDLINKYPYTDFHAVNLDYILKLVRENEGLHLEESGNQILLKTADNTIVSAITAPYAASAGSANTASSASYASSAGSAASATYATSAGSAATATNATNAANATKADFATTAGSATSADSATYATTAGSATNATNAVNAQNAAYAETTGNVEHADNAIESVTLQGDKVRFTTYGGTVTDITIPFATKAQKDDLGNIIKSTYIANVVDNNGQLKFNDAEGNTIVSLTPSVTQAQTDSYGNTIADYVKSVSVESGSDYVTIDHGTGTAETLQIPYSDKAWKDTNGNVIKNTYVKRLEIITDPNDGHKKLVAYNGDNPEAELFRIPVEAYRAQEAAEATHAASADYATNAGTSQNAVNATTAETANNSYYVLKAMAEQNHDEVFNITGCYDANGNAVDFDDIPTTAPLIIAWQTYYISGDPGTYYYPLNHIFTPHTGEKTPIMLEYDNVNVMGDSDSSTGYSLTHDHLDIVYSNGSWFTGNKVHEVYEVSLTPMTP